MKKLQSEKEKEDKIVYLTNLINQKDQEINNLKNQLKKVLNTFRWRFTSMFIDSAKKYKISHLFKSLFNFKKLRSNQENDFNSKQNNNIEMENLNDFNPYKNIQILKEIEILVISEDYQDKKITNNFSMIITAKNEGLTIRDFLIGIENQTLKPKELIIVDGGSTDKTISEIEKFIDKSSLSIKLIKDGSPNIPEGRNIGIKNSSYENIVIADAGNRIDINYTRNLIGSLINYKADLAGGIYSPMKRSKYADYFLIDWDKTDWNSFLPSTRAMAIKKTLAQKCGYFPEYVNSGDDTLFDINYRKISKRWVFNKSIKTLWETVTTRKQFLKVVGNYGRADGEDGIGDYLYSDLVIMQKNNLPLNDTDLRKEQFKSYLEGKEIRAKTEIEKRKIKGLVLFFAKHQLFDNGQDSKILSLIKKYIGDNYKVIYVNSELPEIQNNNKIFIDLDFTLLELSCLPDFNTEDILFKYRKLPNKIVIIQKSEEKKIKSMLNKIHDSSSFMIKLVYE